MARRRRKKIDCPKTKRAKYCRERKISPARFAKSSFRVYTSGKKKYLIACPKGKFRKGRCTTQMKLQSILHPRRSKVCRVNCRKEK